MDWLDLLAVQGTLKSLLQHHSLKASILWHSALFIIQLSHPYMTTGKTIALTRWTFVGKVMSLLFNTRFLSVTAYSAISCSEVNPPRPCCGAALWCSSASLHAAPRELTVVSDSLLPPSDMSVHEQDYLPVYFL